MKQRHKITITLVVDTDEPIEWGLGLVDHLEETFNDDGSILDGWTSIATEPFKGDAP